MAALGNAERLYISYRFSCSSENDDTKTLKMLWSYGEFWQIT